MTSTQVPDSAQVWSRWQEALELGKSLFGLTRQLAARALMPDEILLMLCQATLKNTQVLVNCRVRLRLDQTCFSNFIEKSKVSEFLMEPLSRLMELALRENRVLCVGRNHQKKDWVAYEFGEIEPSMNVVFPIKATGGNGSPDDILVGLLQVESKRNQILSQEDIHLISILVGQAALAFQAFMQLAVESWRQEQLSLVQQVSAQIADMHDLDQLFWQVTRLIQETFSYYHVAVFILEDNAAVLRLRANSRPELTDNDELQEKVKLPDIMVQLGQGLVGTAADIGEEIIANNVVDDERYQKHELLPETRSEAAIPLKIENRILGVLDVQSNQENYFDETDLVVLRALAGNIAVAIEGARLYSSLRRRASQLSVIHEVSNAITSILDTEKLFDEVVSVIQKRFGYSVVHLFSVHPGRGKVFFEAGSSPISSSLRDGGFSYDLDDPQGLIPWVARHGDILLVNDVSQEPRYRPSMFAPIETQSELTVPLIFGGEILGVLDVQSGQVDAFGEEDRFIFEALADHIAIAMRNATLFRSEAWRRHVADSLREVAGLLSADVDVNQVLGAVLDELEQTLPLEIAAIWLLEEDESQENQTHQKLFMAALKGRHAAQLGFEAGVGFDDLNHFVFQNHEERMVEQATAWVNDVLAAKNALIRSPQSHFDPLGVALNYPLDYSAIATPLRVGERSLGILMLAHHTTGRYGSESQAMIEAFASYASVAIENARLYESAHEQAWISTVLLQVAEATQSQTNLNDLLNTVIRITPMLAGVRACLLYIMDEDGNFVPAAASGLDTDQQIEFESWRFAPGDVPALDRLMEERQSILVGLDGEDTRLTNLFTSGEQEDRLLDSDMFVLVPMLSHNEILGAFLVDYSLNGGFGNNERALSSLFDERLAIIQGIAFQTATAVQNIRLNKSQKEEAYVSVALLQVAQAIVSSNDLDEGLGSIVRITPILVGVKRAVIFLWDDSLQAFQVSQAYGIAREAEDRSYPVYEFPLLDCVRQWNALLAYPVDRDLSASEDVLDAWSFLTPPDRDEVDVYLDDEPCLLLGFPLAVKGKVLGVLLVEEPDPVPMDGMGSGNANRRLRAKRLEIITGISQQAALAIQNDILQIETVVQERMAREMQLAREIQQAFLPQSVPELDGWDLRVFWRTAREVGGDFYDFFELPDGRMGLVIADVADKGMPAALFMTLVRTLVRATALQANRPEQVLERVNDLLVPDAPQGMFVTLAYAVLNLETGELEYANAGHNPPLLLRNRSCDLIPFERTGMALGVLEGNHIEGRRIQLEPEDFVIMYTDGVTEAFSPQGEIFGEQRLFETILDVVNSDSAHVVDAQTVLERIDWAVSDFVDEATVSDDLTLVILKCTRH